MNWLLSRANLVFKASLSLGRQTIRATQAGSFLMRSVIVAAEATILHLLVGWRTACSKILNRSECFSRKPAVANTNRFDRCTAAENWKHTPLVPMDVIKSLLATPPPQQA